MKNLLHIPIVIISILIFACNKEKNCSNLQINNESLEFDRKSTIYDSILNHLNDINTNCKIFMIYDCNIYKNVSRFNFFTSIDQEINLLKTPIELKLGDYKIFYLTRLEKYLLNSKIQTLSIKSNCDGNYFVVFDSLGVITCFKNLNDYSMPIVIPKL